MINSLGFNKPEKDTKVVVAMSGGVDSSAVAALFSLSMDSVDEINTMMENGLKAGGIEPTEMKDYGFMQQRTIEDVDGHTWEIFYMDMSKCAAQ